MIIHKIEALIKQTERIVFAEEKMVSNSHLSKVRVKALRDAIQVIKECRDEANANNEQYRKTGGKM